MTNRMEEPLFESHEHMLLHMLAANEVQAAEAAAKLAADLRATGADVTQLQQDGMAWATLMHLNKQSRAGMAQAIREAEAEITSPEGPSPTAPIH